MLSSWQLAMHFVWPDIDLKPASISLSRTCHFASLDHTWGDGAATPRFVCPLIALELRNKDERKVRMF